MHSDALKILVNVIIETADPATARSSQGLIYATLVTVTADLSKSEYLRS